MLLNNFNNTIDLWIDALEQYTFRQLCARPALGSWSMGQLYTHLIDDTNYYIEQIKICLATNDNANEEASPFAKMLFLNNCFPDTIIEGSPSNALILQPASKKVLVDGLLNIKAEISTLCTLISTSKFKGKTKHPGLSYFSAREWLQFADIHFRHHLRQKQKIDDFLKTSIIHPQ
jgi:hypothetical protein